MILEQDKPFSNKKLVGLFAGAFSPVHEAHVARAIEPIENGLVDRVIIVPSSDAYHKPGLIPSSKRLELLRQAFQGQNSIIISTIDTDKSYWPDPLETAHEVKQLYLLEGEALIWIMGGDRLHWIANHSNLKAITDEYSLLVFNRPPHDEISLLQNSVIRSYRQSIVFLDCSVPPMSSTEIRLREKNHA